MAEALPYPQGTFPRVPHLGSPVSSRGGRLACAFRALLRSCAGARSRPLCRGWELVHAALLVGSFLAFAEGRAFAQTATPRVEAVYPHDTTAFTQGLELFEGKLFESTGLTGSSTLRRVAVTTGVVEKNLNLASTLFAEGLTRIDRQLIQLTYTTGIAIVYDLDTFAELKRFTYTGEGWGLCYDGTDLVMTNGSDTLFFRDPATFAVRRQVVVRRNGTAIDMLNELECVGSLVYINEWQTDNILRVDKATGNVLTLIDASALLTADEKRNANVLNGIAYDEAKRRFYLTGKHWPKLFEVSFDFDPGGAGDAGIVDAGTDRSTMDANPPRDGAGDATNEGTAVDVATPRDTGSSRDGADDGARDAASSDVRPTDAPTGDASAPPDSNGQGDAAGAGGAGGSGGSAGTGGTGDAGSAGDAGSGPTQEGCACRTRGALAGGSLSALAMLLAVALARRVRSGARRG